METKKMVPGTISWKWSLEPFFWKKENQAFLGAWLVCHLIRWGETNLKRPVTAGKLQKSCGWQGTNGVRTGGRFFLRFSWYFLGARGDSLP